MARIRDTEPERLEEEVSIERLCEATTSSQGRGLPHRWVYDNARRLIPSYP